MVSWNAVVLSIQYLLWSVGVYGLVFWLPSIIRRLTESGIGTSGALSAVVYAGAIMFMVVASALSDPAGSAPALRLAVPAPGRVLRRIVGHQRRLVPPRLRPADRGGRGHVRARRPVPRHDPGAVPRHGRRPGQRHVTDLPAVVDAAARLGVTPAQVGLAWLLAHASETMLIPGTRSAAHLEENLAAGDVVLDAEAMAALGS